MIDTVAVALCTYNGARYLQSQLDSIATQTRPPDELVVTDDASSDGSVALLQRFAAGAAFPVRIHVNKRNLGSTRSFEEAIARCACTYVALCDQDDVWLPPKLERLTAALQSDPEAGYAFSDAQVVDQSLQPMALRMWQTVGLDPTALRVFAGPRQIDLLLERTIVTGATMMIRASRFEICRPIPETTVHDMWLALLLTALGAHGIAVNEPLVLYRQHDLQQIGVRAATAPGGLRARMQREFVMARRRLVRQQAERSKMIIGRLDQLLEPGSALDDRARQHVQRARTLLRARERHVAGRVALDRASTLQTVKTLLSELLRGRYRRYSGGINALLADLLYCSVYRGEDENDGHL